MVHPDFWRQGVGTSLMTAVLDLADSWLNLLRIQLEVYTHNEAAIHLYNKFGFEVEGTKHQAVFGDGRYFDTLVMARLRHLEWFDNQPEEPPPRPRKPRPEISQVIIRPPLNPGDKEDLYTLFRHPEVGRTTLQLPSQEISKTRERLETVVPGLYRYVAEVDGRVVGNATLHQSQNPRARHVADLGMAVHPDYWGLGIGSRLLEALMQLADNWLNLTRVELEVNVDNPAGVRLYHKFGFEIEGTHRMHAYGDGRMADSYFMGRIRE
jgi:putative acetyltransferase